MLYNSSLARVQLGAMHPFRMQTMCSTFSIRICGFTMFFRSIRWAFVSLLIDCSVIITAY